MSDTTKSRRIDWIKKHNMGGSTDWAVDLAGWFEGSDKDREDEWNIKTDVLDCDSSKWPKTLEDLEKDIGNVPKHCRGQALLRVLVSGYESAIREYREVSQTKDYDDKFKWVSVVVLTSNKALGLIT